MLMPLLINKQVNFIYHYYSAQAKAWRPSLKSGFFFFFFLLRCGKSALLRCWLVASQQSDADWFMHTVFQSRALALASLFSVELLMANCTKFRERQRWELERHITITRVKSNNTYIFAFFVFDLFYVRQEKHQKILLHSETVLFCRMFCVIIGTLLIGDSVTQIW